MVHCAAQTPVNAPELTAQPLPNIDSLPYVLHAGDQLGIRFWDVPELDQDVLIRPDGMISLPYVDDVQAAGRTAMALDEALTKLYASELKYPVITVEVKQALANRVFVGGEVTQQGPIPLVGELTLVQAIQEAGGLRFTARRKQVLLIRTLPNGERVARSLDLRPILSGENPMLDPRLQAADIVFVPRTKINNVNLWVEQYLNRVIPVGPIVVRTLQ